MVYEKYNGVIPFKLGDTVEFYENTFSGKILRKGKVTRIDEFGYGYNLHLKCEYVRCLGCGAVVYPLKQEVRIVQ